MGSRLFWTLVVLMLSACGGGADVRSRDGSERELRAHGFSVVLPPGWYGDVRGRERDTAPLLRLATYPLDGAPADSGQRAQAEMGEGDVLVTVADYGPVPGRPGPAESLPITLGRSDVTSFEGFREPVATRSFVVRGRTVQLWAVFGEGAPGEESLARANEVLRTLSFTSRRVEAGGLGLELREGWDGYARHYPDGAAAVHAATIPWPDPPGRALERLPADGIAIAARSLAVGARGRELSLPVDLADGTPLVGTGPRLSTVRIAGGVGGRSLDVRIHFGRRDPTAAMRAEANALLSTLLLEPAPVPVTREHRDPALGVGVRYPAGWHVAERPLTGLSVPREVLALATYPLHGGDSAGECAPERARADMPADGAFVWLLEYRQARGEDWTDLPRERFPPQPERFELDRGALDERVSCFAGVGRSSTFRAADRAFQLLVAFGGDPPGERLREVEAILDSLVLDPLPDDDRWTRRLGRNGYSVAVPEGWDGRVLFRDATGATGVLLQVASFELPGNEGLEPPRPLPPGHEDPIKGMDRADALLTVATDAAGGRRLTGPIRFGDLGAVEGVGVPHGHTLREGSFCVGARCVQVTADFGGAPAGELVAVVDEAVASLALEP